MAEASAPACPDAELRRLYLDLLARALVNLVYPEHELRLTYVEEQGLTGDRVADARALRDVRYDDPSAFETLRAAKVAGETWRGGVTRDAHTTVGLRRLEHLETCAVRVFADGVQGDFLEAGVGHGGASIFLRGLQVAYGEERRRTWLADPFESGLQAVQDNFRTYDLLSDEVRFLPGPFADTLPGAPVERLAILRVDAGLSAPTRDVLAALDDRVAPGGYVIVDDGEESASWRKGS
jgi:hypothetical protein